MGKEAVRKEATLEEWKKLYALGKRFIELKPWEQFYNSEYVSVRFSSEDKAYFTIMGNGGLEYGFGMYAGDQAFREMNLQYYGEDDPNYDDYTLYLQNCVVMFMDKKEDVPPEQMKIIEKLGLKFGKGRKWLYFESHARGYLPYIIDQKEVRDTIRYLEKLLEALPAILNIKPVGMHVMNTGYVYQKSDDGWQLCLAEFDKAKLKDLKITTDESTVQMIKKGAKALKTSWEVDLVFPGFFVKEKAADRPESPYMLTVLDHKNGSVIYNEMQRPQDDLLAVFEQLTSLIDKVKGYPKAILVHGTIMMEILSSFGESFGIPVLKDPLKKMDEFASGLKRSMKASAPGGEGFLNSLGISDNEINSLLQMAGAGSEAELMKILSERVAMMKGSGNDLPNPFSEFYEDMFDQDESMYPGLFGPDEDPVFHSYSNMRMKRRIIEDFYEYTTEPDMDPDDDFYGDDFCDGIIDSEWFEGWEKLFEQCSKACLSDLAKKIGLSVTNKKKSELAAQVGSSFVSDPKLLKKVLSENEIGFIKKVRELANKKTTKTTDEFPYDSEMIIGLAEKGIIDIQNSTTWLAEYLRIQIPVELKGVRL